MSDELKIEIPLGNVYLFKVKDYTTTLIGIFDEENRCFYVQRGDGVKWAYDIDRTSWYRKINVDIPTYKYIKKDIKGYNVLNMYPVYSDKIYKGKEPFKIVGIRENEVELQGDFSAINNTIGTEWFKNEDVFIISTIEGDIINTHKEYWKEYFNDL